LKAATPRNPLTANACFEGGYIDSWGRGIRKITEACAAAKLPNPLIEETQGGIRVTLFSEPTLQGHPVVGNRSTSQRIGGVLATEQVIEHVTEQAGEQVAKVRSKSGVF
jgi:ATP-dependent DNA helicase RecG